MICIYHSRDLDGWMSAAIVKLKHPDIELIGWDYGQPIPKINDVDGVIMVDVSFSPEEMLELSRRVRWNLKWIDHHISAIKAYNEFVGQGESFLSCRLNDKFAACELAWQYFFPDKSMPEIVRLLGRYDCFGHKGTDEEQKVLDFQYAARAQITNPEEAYKALISIKDQHISGWLDVGQGIYSYLCTEARQTYERKFDIDFDGYKFGCVNDCRFNPVNFGIKYHEDGYDGFACFHYQNSQFIYSLYNDNGLVDCSVICKKRGGGGHKGAAGFQTKEMILN